MGKVKFDYSNAMNFFNEDEIMSMQQFVDVAHKMVHEKTGLGNDFLGWVDLPNDYDKEEFVRIKEAADNI